MPVATGLLKHTMTIFAPAGTSDDHPNTDTNIATGVPAAIENTDNQFQQAERISAGGVRGFVSLFISMRYRDMRADWQLIEECCNERRFQIVNITQDDDMRFIKMTVHKVL